MIYIQKVHLKSSDERKLHKFARDIGLSRSWFHLNPEPYYDIICPHMIERALKFGAVLLDYKK